MFPEVEPQLGFDYLEAIDQAGLEVRGCPLGPVFVAQQPWCRLSHLFLPSEPGPYLNMVCAPPSFVLGRELTGVMVAPDLRIAKDRTKATTDVVYQPFKAITALYTAGVRNIAVVAPQSVSLAEDEVQALRRYDQVFCPSEPATRVLAALDIKAVHAPPEPEALAALLRPLVP